MVNQQIYLKVKNAVKSMPITPEFELNSKFYRGNSIIATNSQKREIGKQFFEDTKNNLIPKVQPHMYTQCPRCGNKRSNNHRYYDKN